MHRARHIRLFSFVIFACLVFATTAAYAVPGGQGNGNANGHNSADPGPVGDPGQPSDNPGNGKSDEPPPSDPKDVSPSDGSFSFGSTSGDWGGGSASEGKGKSGGSNGAGKKNGRSADTSLSSSASSSAQGGGGNQAFDPDPPPQATSPATTGPTGCTGPDQQTGGPYDHDNCDGSQGLNGNGGNGKCAGCTGKADDKSPGGQHPGDHNNGYECDHNKGVGKGNPAHSKCKTTTPPCTSNCNPCTSNCNPCTSNCNSGCEPNCGQGCQVDCDPDCLDVLPAAQCDDDDVLGTIIRRALPSLRSGDVDPAVAAGAVLPFTGGDPTPIVVIGLTLILVGGGITAQVGRKRRRIAYLDREGLPTP